MIKKMTVSEYSKIAVNHSYRGKGSTGISRQAALYRVESKNRKKYPEIVKVKKVENPAFGNGFNYVVYVDATLLQK